MPAFIANYPAQYKRILGYLKELGVSHIYSVSFGADICTWGYLKYFEKTWKERHDFKSMSGSCKLYREV